MEICYILEEEGKTLLKLERLTKWLLGLIILIIESKPQDILWKSGHISYAKSEERMTAQGSFGGDKIRSVRLGA